MEFTVSSPGGRGGSVRAAWPTIWRGAFQPAVQALVALLAIIAGEANLQASGGGDQPAAADRAIQAARSAQKPTLTSTLKKGTAAAKPAAKPRPAAVLQSPEPAVAPILPGPVLTAQQKQRYKVRDEFGECVVARFHGQFDDKTALLLPDGQLGTPTRLVPTDDPFQPLSADQLETLLSKGPYADYRVLKTDHYLIFYQSTQAFAQDSGRLLDDLYKGLMDAFRRNGFPVHEHEFPLVAVIFATEKDFRAHKKVDPQVQAYYEFFTNRIFFYQKSERDRLEPKLANLLKPQTVAHEGAHQILSNIGLQPRPCAWPLWLVEGLAEYCATTVYTKKGIVWRGLAAINSLHMATLRELSDPLSNADEEGAIKPIHVSRQRAITETESLLLKTSLTPTDYANAWALTHYLAQKHAGEFVKYLKVMSQVPPLKPRTPQENLAVFREFFGADLSKLDKQPRRIRSQAQLEKELRSTPVFHGDFRAAARQWNDPSRGHLQSISADD